MNTVIENLYDEPTQTVESVIDKCTKVIERDAMVAGAGRRIRNPMLSMFFGSGAIAHTYEIQQAYFSCWSDYAKRLNIIRNQYTVPEIEASIVHAIHANNNYLDQTKIRLIWFWDIMDDNFDSYFECLKQDFSVPVGLICEKTIFVFCSQSTSANQEKTRKRLKEQLIPWARETNNYLVVLSDSTQNGVLDAAGIAENYRLAANLLLIMNSAYPSGTNDIGSAMAFNFSRKPVWSAGYVACSMNYYDIVGISLRRIIQKSLSLSRKTMEKFTGVEELLCGENKGYFDFLDEIFEKVIIDHCPENYSFWYDVPYTESIGKFEQNIYGTNSGKKRGLFSGLFKNMSREVTAEEAIMSLGDFWNCCVDRYYINPITEWMTSPEGNRAITDFIYSRMTSKWNTAIMKTKLHSEYMRVAAMADEISGRIMANEIGQYPNVPSVFHAYAVREVKLRLYGTLLKMLLDAMRNLEKNAENFEDLLEMILNTLVEAEMDHSIVVAYGNHMETLISNNVEILNQCIRPCETEGQLLQQLERAFKELVACDQENVYQMTLQENLQFLIRYGNAAEAIKVVSDCFRYNLTEAGRLHAYGVPEGELYCVMNDAMNELITDVKPSTVGNQFIVNRSDRIERLFLYSVDPERIRYSNKISDEE